MGETLVRDSGVENILLILSNNSPQCLDDYRSPLLQEQDQDAQEPLVWR